MESMNRAELWALAVGSLPPIRDALATGYYPALLELPYVRLVSLLSAGTWVR